MTSTIATPRGLTYQRHAWTGGDRPDIDFSREPIAQDLISAFYNEQVAECGGLDLWECAGTAIQDRKDIFQNRALFDAWRTMHP